MKNKFKIFIRFGLRFLASFAALSVLTGASLFAQGKIDPKINSQKNNLTVGYSLIDGDIQMPTAFVEGILQGHKPSSPNATYQTNLWPGIVPYEFDDNVTLVNRFNMRQAMAVLENVAQVVFVECQSSCQVNNYVHIQNSTGNNSAVGMIGGQQIINIFNWNVQFIMVHELLHCLGFFHEQSRPDRNNFVTINCNNVQGGCNGTIFNNNFIIQNAASVFGPYDFDSVMHYGQCSFTVGANCPADGTQTITVNPPYNTQWQNAIGQRTHLSVFDQATVSFLYPHNDWSFLDCTYDGSSGGSNGSFLRPYTTFAAAIANTPAGGTIWVTKICYFYQSVGTYGNRVTIKAVPGVIASFGN